MSLQEAVYGLLISIHAPHARSDTQHDIRKMERKKFQSTLLMRGATLVGQDADDAILLFQSTLLMRGATRRFAALSL